MIFLPLPLDLHYESTQHPLLHLLSEEPTPSADVIYGWSPREIGFRQLLRLRRNDSSIHRQTSPTTKSELEWRHRMTKADGRGNLGLKGGERRVERNLLKGRRIWSCFLPRGRPTCFAPLSPSLSSALPSRSFYRPRLSALARPRLTSLSISVGVSAFVRKGGRAQGE